MTPDIVTNSNLDIEPNKSSQSDTFDFFYTVLSEGWVSITLEILDLSSQPTFI